MAEGSRLLERIRAMARDPNERRPPDVEELRTSILNHLTRLLNTRQGSSVIAGDYGVPDFSALCTSPNAANIARIEELLTSVITRYEPRLGNIRAEFFEDRDDPLKMRFTLSAELRDVDGDEKDVRFQTVITPNGRVNIRRQDTRPGAES